MAKKSKNLVPVAPQEDDILHFKQGDQVPGVFINIHPSEIRIDENIAVELFFSKEVMKERYPSGLPSHPLNLEVRAWSGTDQSSFNEEIRFYESLNWEHGIFKGSIDLKKIESNTGIKDAGGWMELKFLHRTKRNSSVTYVQGKLIELIDFKSQKWEVLAIRDVPILPSIKDLIEPEIPDSQISLVRAGQQPTEDQILWPIIRNRVISFNRYKAFMDQVMCEQPLNGQRQRLPFTGVESYSLLKFATEAYMQTECGLVENDHDGNVYNDPLWKPDRRLDHLAEKSRLGWDPEPGRLLKLRNHYLQRLGEESNAKVLPYFKMIREKLADLPLKTPREAGNCYGILRSNIAAPCLVELIWSYWQEQGMLVQAMNAISLRFQNIPMRSSGHDPLARLDIDPLRPLSNILWGYIQDEQHRLSLNRRVFEYQHQYDLQLLGKAVPQLRAVDVRANFLEAFNTLLYSSSVFYVQADDATRIADGFPILNSLRELHMLLAEGYHNAYGSLTWTARQEMMIMQWILARPEFREFIGGRIMVPYKEPWMDRMDAMRTMQSWGSASVTHFNDLATYGEQLLLSVRFGNWSVIEDRNAAANWAIYWRNEIQRYIHAYRVVTGVDLSVDSLETNALNRSIQPASLIQQRQMSQQLNGVRKPILNRRRV